MLGIPTFQHVFSSFDIRDSFGCGFKEFLSSLDQVGPFIPPIFNFFDSRFIKSC